MTSFAILLALIAFAPTRTIAKEPGGGQGGGHPGGGQPSTGQHGTGNAATHYEAAPNPAGTGNAGTTVHQEATPNLGGTTAAGATVRQAVAPNLGGTTAAGTTAHQNAAAHVNPQLSVAAGAGAAASADSWRYRSDNGRWWYWTPQNRWMWYGDNGQWVDYSADNYPTARAYVVQRPILVDPLPAAGFSGGPITISNPAANKVTLSYTLDGTAYTIAPGYTQELREDRAWAIQFSRGANLAQARYGLQSGLYSFTSTDHGWELYRSEYPHAE